ncbi:MAG: alpha-galactosidase, partial [Naasia sp.]
SSRLRHERPELMATRSVPDGVQKMTVSLDPDDPGFLGYVCLGSGAGREFVAEALHDAVSTTGARWLKLDFNVDPGSGCDRTDHGHGAGDGLLRHYEGLYAVLDAFRARHPEVILEACASGGLRIDLGLARHVHCFFLSDPDWTEHHLQVLWGASLLLPPAAMLHWSWSQWRGENPDQDLDFASLDADRFTTMLRAAMLQRFGISLRVDELPAGLQDVLAAEVDVYRREIAPLLREGVLRRLTGQPLRRGAGERCPAFQVDSAAGHLLAAFALDGGASAPPLAFTGLIAGATYEVRDLGSDAEPRRALGSELMDAHPAAHPAASSRWMIARRR